MEPEEDAMVLGMRDGATIRIAELEAEVERLKAIENRQHKSIHERDSEIIGWKNQLQIERMNLMELTLKDKNLILEHANENLKAEAERLRDDICYWSRCTWKGMESTCPEKEKTLRKRFAELKISPWIDPTQ